MNKYLKTGVVVGILIVVGAVFYLTSRENPTSQASSEIVNSLKTEVAQTPVQNKNEEKLSAVAINGVANYVDYSEQVLADSSGDSRIVFFHADWCSTCVFYEGQIEKTGVPDGITVLKADYDTEKELKERYGVSVQSTFVLLGSDGEVVKTWPFASGLRGIQDLYDAVIKLS